MKILREELLQQMENHGDDLMGVANLSGIHELKTGISVAVAFPQNIIASIHNGPAMEYYNEYYRIHFSFCTFIKKYSNMDTQDHTLIPLGYWLRKGNM